MSAAREHVQDEQYPWPRPPAEGWTADDLDRLPDLPPHTELIDGNLVFMSPQTRFHARTIHFLVQVLTALAPEHLEAIAEMTLNVDRRNRPEPDVLVVPLDADTGPRQTSFHPSDVVLAVEVVSEDSLERDREIKPVKYAQAGVPHFWRVEESEGLPVVYTYERDPATRTYGLTGIHHKQLVVDRPFAMDIDLTAAGRRGFRAL
ncbi:Uma2 family endonuclease [Streptomyces sp. NPDC057638]|uniref:Uma2 family endonuclease n=1 Tax=Streptomyces sp. NPDC057638 TaxID=3346190 RepID=UPI0036B4112A